MQENVIIKFNLDYEVSIYADNNLLGKSGYQDTFKCLVENDALLTFKKGTKKAMIKVFKDKENKIAVGYSTTGQLKASYWEEKEEPEVTSEKTNKEEKTENKEINNNVSNANNPNNQNSSDTMSTIIGILVILAIVYGVYNFGKGIFSDNDSKTSTTEKEETKEDKERNARYQIAALIKEADSKYIYLYNTYSIGKITSANCSHAENEYVNEMFLYL